MGSPAGDRDWTGGVTGAGAEAGALVWVFRRDGCWWPGRILGTDELPENCAIPPRCDGTPVKLLGRPDGNIYWYNLEKSKCVKPFRCGEFDECIENAKVQHRLQNMAYSKGKYALRDDAIMHALRIEMPRFPIEEPTNQTTECNKEDMSSIQGCRKTKMKLISFVTPIAKENYKRDNCSLPQLDKGPMKCQALEVDAAGFDARVEGPVFKPTELESDIKESNIKVYGVEIAAYGNYKGHGLPLACLISKSAGKTIKGYPITVEVLEDSCPSPSTKVHPPAISCFDCLMETRSFVPRQARSLRKPSCRKLEHNLDKSPRKILREKSNRDPVVSEEFLPPIRSPSKQALSPRQMQSFSDTWRENTNREPLVEKGSPRPNHSPPIDAMDVSESNADQFHSGAALTSTRVRAALFSTRVRGPTIWTTT